MNPTKKTGVNSGAPEGLEVPVPHVTLVMLLLTVKLLKHEYPTKQMGVKTNRT